MASSHWIISHHEALRFIAKGGATRDISRLRIFASCERTIVLEIEGKKRRENFLILAPDSRINEFKIPVSLYTRNFHGKWKAKLAANYPRVGRKSRIRGDRGDTYHLEIFLLNLRKESLSKVLDSQVFNDSIIPRPGVGRSRPMTRAIGHGSKVWPKRCNECHCTRPVLRRGSTCDAKRGGKKGRRKRDAVARERETKRDLIHRDACHSMSRVRFYG